MLPWQNALLCGNTILGSDKRLCRQQWRKKVYLTDCKTRFARVPAVLCRIMAEHAGYVSGGGGGGGRGVRGKIKSFNGF
jgi:hypothetical protein